MFVTKSSLIIFLVVITIIQNGFAADSPGSYNEYEDSEARLDEEARLQDEAEEAEEARLAEEQRLVQECEDLMIGRWYEADTEDGMLNFRKSYEDLTYALIYNEFNPPTGNESPDKRQTRLLERELFTGYFLELESTTGLDFTKYPIEPLSVWCKSMAGTAEGTCASAVIQFFQINDSTLPSDIFSKFYHDWNVQMIQDRHMSRPSGSSYSGLNYPLAFFGHYQKRTLHPIYTQYGTFKTIHQFCVDKGKEDVRNRDNLRGYVFGELDFDDE